MLTAFLIIDMQKNLLQREIFQKQSLITNINRILDAFHESNAPVFFIRHTNNSFLKVNTDGWQLCEGLYLAETDTVLDKTTSSVFKLKNFVALLESSGIDHVVIGGLVSNGCVQAACTDGKKHGYSVTLISDAHSTFHKGAEQVILEWNERLKAEGIDVVTTDEYIKNHLKT